MTREYNCQTSGNPTSTDRDSFICLQHSIDHGYIRQWLQNSIPLPNYHPLLSVASTTRWAAKLTDSTSNGQDPVRSSQAKNSKQASVAQSGLKSSIRRPRPSACSPKSHAHHSQDHIASTQLSLVLPASARTTAGAKNRHQSPQPVIARRCSRRCCQCCSSSRSPGCRSRPATWAA